jgi:UDP-glucose 4-epimerase
MAMGPLTEFCKANIIGVLSLVRRTADSGVQQFIFISSISESDDLNLVEPYVISKQEAESELRQLANQGIWEL